RRRTVIKPHQLRPWFEAVLSLSHAPNGQYRPSTDGAGRDYLLLLILTGLRNREAATLQWENVDLTGKTLTVYDTKNRQDHTLPLSDYLFAMLTTRHANRINAYVFPAASGNGHLRTSQTSIAKVRAASGVSFTPHDLRRTFATVADSLDIPGYAVKALLNHKPSDVTAGYIVTDVERLRVPMQRITDYMLGTAGLKQGAEVASMHAVMNTA
ncbi:MAG TPA: tyrosine-type recombinase/integrase, partial [Gammaproteobacteria bacterium]|nr:tyrosine-type recombinase/integrase [Gammaproteobacteria bacterium]